MPIRIDAHMDIPWLQTKVANANANASTFDYRHGHDSSIFTLDGAKEGGLDAAIFALYLSDAWQDSHTIDEIDREINTQANRLYKSGVFVANGASNLKDYRASFPNLFYILMGLEGGRLIHNSLERLKKLKDLGICYLTLTHNRTTDWADSATDDPRWSGLSPFGINVIKECNKLKILVDVSHASDLVVLDALTCSSKPIAATHSGCRALVKQPRNLPNNLIKAIAESGGIVCVPYVKKFIGHYSPAEHIRHIVDLVGANHVGIGSDIDGAVLVNGFTNVNQWKNQVLTDLESYGYDQATINKIMGDNLIRVLGKA